MNDNDIELRLDKLLRNAPIVPAPQTLCQAVTADRAPTRPPRVTPKETSPAPRPIAFWRGRRARTVSALAGLAATVVLAAGLLVIVANRPTSPAASPDTAGRIERIDWKVGPAPESEVSGRIYQLNGQVMYFGQAVWRLDEGSDSWVKLTASDPFGDNDVLGVVEDGQGGLIAYGDNYPANDAGTTALVWLSSDGSTWTQVALGQGVIRKVVVGPSGPVALGDSPSKFECGANPDHATAWTLGSDGTWTQITLPGGPSSVTHAILWHGQIVVAGYRSCWDTSVEAPPTLPPDFNLIWTSTDGMSWQGIATSGFPTSGGAIQMPFLASHGDSVIAFDVSGFAASNVPLVSNDLSSWRAVSLPLQTASPTVWWVTDAGSEYLAFGDDCALWTSVDGDAWSQLPSSPGPGLWPASVHLCSGATVSGDRIVLDAGSDGYLVGTIVRARPAATPTPTATEREYPRQETLYTTGTEWAAPSTWNPLDANAATGTVGLQYETLFLYDPLADEFEPWLAESGTWTDAAAYTIKVRSGIKWTDGRDLTAEDVAFTIGLYRIKALGSNIWDQVTDARATDASTVVVTFEDPVYQEWATWTYNSPILPKHIWEGKANENILSEKNKDGVGSGPYEYEYSDQDRMVWARNDGWWGKTAKSLDMKPRYIVDVVNAGSTTVTQRLVEGSIDLSNNYLAGIDKLGDSGISTYYSSAPYMLSANTTWLVTNDRKKPLDDPQFRLALATAIDTNDIVTNAYGNLVRASGPTGLLPTWDKYVDKAQRDALGFKFDTARAKSILKAAGYPVGGDGMVRNKDGSALKLSITCPDGWADWMAAIDSIAAGARLAGIDIEVEPTLPTYDAFVAARDSGNFDLLLDNSVGLSNTPWHLYDYIFHSPLESGAGKSRNYGKYENPTAWALVQELDRTPIDDVEAVKAITSELQKIQFEDTPVIPLWYGGLWSQVSNLVWTNWPSDAGYHVLPSATNGYWQMGAIRMLANIEPAQPAP
jgi:peptide/nickel transport system substrate-binding protein